MALELCKIIMQIKYTRLNFVSGETMNAYFSIRELIEILELAEFYLVVYGRKDAKKAVGLSLMTAIGLTAYDKYTAEKYAQYLSKPKVGGEIDAKKYKSAVKRCEEVHASLKYYLSDSIALKNSEGAARDLIKKLKKL